MNSKINRIVSNAGITMNKVSDNLPSNFSRLEKAYKEFCANINKTDFANSPRRYMIENTLVRDLVKSAREHKLSSLEEFYSRKVDEIVGKLKEFGIEIT